MKIHFYVLATITWVGIALAESTDSQIEGVFEEYFKIHSSLSQDSTSGVDASAQAIVEKVSATKSSNPELQGLLDELKQAAKRIQGNDLKAARAAFFSLSKPLLLYLNKFDTGDETHYRFFCPMEKKGWIQADKDTKNPYYGSSMPGCGNLIE